VTPRAARNLAEAPEVDAAAASGEATQIDPVEVAAGSPAGPGERNGGTSRGGRSSRRRGGRRNGRERSTEEQPVAIDRTPAETTTPVATAPIGASEDSDGFAAGILLNEKPVAPDRFVPASELKNASSVGVAEARPMRGGRRRPQRDRRDWAPGAPGGRTPVEQASETERPQGVEKSATNRRVEFEPEVHADEVVKDELPAAYAERAELDYVDDRFGDELVDREDMRQEDVAVAEPITPPSQRGKDRGRRPRGRRGRGEDRPYPEKAGARPPSGRSRFMEDDDDERESPDVEEEVTDDDEELVPGRSVASTGKREMVINVSGADECRIAILHEGRLEELFIERASSQSHVGNIYKGRVTNVEPSIQAAFIDFGFAKNGFLHISDVQPQYFPNRTTEVEEVGRKIPRHHRPPIQKCFRRGQEVIVQITKEGVGTKGPTLTSYLSIPGRYLVMMPGMNRHGVSRKIEDEAARRKMKDILNELEFPPGMGFILRTAGLDQTKRELQRDLNYMIRLWKRVVDRVRRFPAPAELYRESDLVTRTIRDVYTTDFDRLIVDDADAAKKATEFFQIAMPRSKPRIEVYTDPEPLFHRLGIEDEIERINARHVPLPSGGSLVIDTTEALVAIDVNSGRFRSPDDAEETAVRINVEAAEEIARQLRLRDLGGLIVCDFIDMRMDRNKRKVERALRDALKKHKERARILRMSAFGLIEMTRQRQGPSLKRNIYFDCPHCRGSGLVKMPESVILDVMRTIQLVAYNPQVQKLRVTVSTEVAYQILNTKRTAISKIETSTGKRVMIRGDMGFTSDQVECVCEDGRGQPLTIGGIRPTQAGPWPGNARAQT